MRYQKLVYIDDTKYEMLQKGTLKLQAGQWIQLAWCLFPSRWVGITSSGSLWAVHFPVNNNRFYGMCQSIERFQHENKSH